MVRANGTGIRRGEDAVMVAKQNAEVIGAERDAREVRRPAGQLGGRSRSRRASFADGVSSSQGPIRARNLQPRALAKRRVDAAGGVDPRRHRQARRSRSRDYWPGPPHSEAPALEHAYAVTT